MQTNKNHVLRLVCRTQVIERANNNCYGLASGIIRWGS